MQYIIATWGAHATMLFSVLVIIYFLFFENLLTRWMDNDSKKHPPSSAIQVDLDRLIRVAALVLTVMTLTCMEYFATTTTLTWPTWNNIALGPLFFLRAFTRGR